MMSVVVLLIMGLGVAFPRDSEAGLLVRSVRPGFIETKPLNTVTLVFSVLNASNKTHEFSPEVELPEGWSLVIEETGFRMNPGEEAVRLVLVFVPVRAAMGTYRVGYALSAQDDPALSGRAEAEVHVLLEAKLAVEAAEGHHLAIAGDKCRSAFLVTNWSNAALDVNFEVKSNGSGVSLGVRTARLEAGESRAVEIAVATDPHLVQKLSQQVQLTATARVPEMGPVAASAMTEFEIIPRVSGKGDYFNRIPTEVGLAAIAADGARGYGQFKFSGAGALDSDGNRRLDFYFRGPGRRVGRDLTYPFGLQPEEYRMSYESANLNIHAGDGCFSLTRLTETGNYGRGLDVSAAFDKWSFRGYFERLLLWSETEHEGALQIGWRAGDYTKFNLSYLTRQDPERPKASQIFSLQSELSRKHYHLKLEYSWDWSSLGGFRPANSALWIEGRQSTKRWSSQVNLIRSGAQYHGYYENLAYNSVEAAYASSERWGLRASFLDQKTHTAVEPYVQPFYDRTIQAGAYYQAFRRLSLSLDERIHDRRDLSGQDAFDYQDSTLRLGAFFYSGTFGLQNFIDVGRTLNRLTRNSERLTEYTVSANYLALGRISLAAYLHYRNQKESFTGDKIRRLDLNFNLGLQWGQLDLSAFYRTAVIDDLYRNPLAPGDFLDPAFMLNNYDTFGANLTYRFRNGHSVGFRIQRVANPFWDGHPPKALIGLVEYSIPVGIPINRKRTVGMLRGRIYDAQRGQEGVPGVIVKVNDLATVTGPRGEYAFNGLTPGPYVLTLDDRRARSGKVAVEKLPMTVIVEGGRKLDRPILLTAGASLGGRIVIYDFAKNLLREIVRKEPESGAPAETPPSGKESGEGATSQLVERAPLCGTTVELRGEGDVFEQVTDSQGRFLFDGLRPGSYTLKVFEDNLPEFHVFERDTFEFDLKSGAKEELTIKVVPVVRSIEIIDRGEVKIKKKRDADR
jgi:hypothetical protein